MGTNNLLFKESSLDGSLKYVGWNSYTELPPEKIFLASKSIAQEYLFHHF
jgi:hypothetical protein